MRLPGTETNPRINLWEAVPTSLRVFLATALLSSGCIPWKPWSPWDSQHPQSDLCRLVDYKGGVKAMECHSKDFSLEITTYSSGTKGVVIEAASNNSRLRGAVDRLDNGTWYSEQRLRWNGKDLFDSQDIRQP